MILCIETATTTCSVALCDNKKTVASRENREGKSHSSMLTVYINEILNEAGIKPADLEAVAVSKGPGSYTGLRIGVSVAKGIAYGASVPLVGIDTTLSMFHGFITEKGREDLAGEPSFFIPAIDARRMEIYYSVFNSGGEVVKDVQAGIIDSDSFSDLPISSGIIIFGDGAAKCRATVKRGGMKFVDDFMVSAEYLRGPAYMAISAKRFEDVAYFEPLYLKDFLTSKPVKNLLRK